jgi:hypothetical protein
MTVLLLISATPVQVTGGEPRAKLIPRQALDPRLDRVAWIYSF